MKILSMRSALAATLLAVMAPLSLSAAAEALAQTPAAPPPTLDTLVVIQLAGGNDGLQTVIPYADPAYPSLRPSLAVPVADVIKLSSSLGLDPHLAALMDSWKAGDFAIALGVGYPDPNRSHFRATDIWETASASDTVLETGWLARLLNAAPRPPGIIADSLILGEPSAGPLRGPGMHNLTMDNLDAFLRDAAQLEPRPTASTGTVGYINSVQDDIIRAAGLLASIKPDIKEPSIPFPATAFAGQMKTAFQLLAAGARVPVIKLTLRGFDDHSAERTIHDRLLSDLAGAVAAFRANLISSGLWDNVLIMTYSEFGRRVMENGSQGTDHGTAAPVFLWGGRVRGGFIGTEPPLSDLDQGDLKYTLDFRVLYRSVATEFLGVQDPAILDKAVPGITATVPLVWPLEVAQGAD